MMTKPTDVLNRDREWKTLTGLWTSPKPQLVLVTGRRRIGKSYLLSRFAHRVEGIYYQATKRAEKEQFVEISRLVGSRFGDTALEAGGSFPSWEAVFDYLARRAREEPLLIVLDEFPYLVESAPALPSIIQKYWDHHWQDGGLKLVLSGSYVSAMRGFEQADQPLYGRRTARLLVNPFTYREAGLFTPAYSPRDRLIAYGVFGHLPGNLALQEDAASLEESIETHFLRPSGRLADDAQTVLDAFLGESSVYYAILETVAGGHETWKGITSRVGRTGGSLSRPLQWLEEMGLIERVTPITEKNPASSRRSRYRVADPYIRFWHDVISPLVSAGMLEIADSERLWTKRVAPRLDDHMGPVFEKACRDAVRRGVLPYAPMRVGEWWDASSTQHVDVVAIGEADELFVGECKWGAIARQDLGTLRERAASIARELSTRPSKVLLGFFSGSSAFDTEIEEAAERGDVLCYSANDLY